MAEIIDTSIGIFTNNKTLAETSWLVTYLKMGDQSKTNFLLNSNFANWFCIIWTSNIASKLPEYPIFREHTLKLFTLPVANP